MLFRSESKTSERLGEDVSELPTSFDELDDDLPSTSSGTVSMEADRHRVRRNWSATHGRPHQAIRKSSTHGVEGDDRHEGSTRNSSRIRGRIVR